MIFTFDTKEFTKVYTIHVCSANTVAICAVHVYVHFIFLIMFLPTILPYFSSSVFSCCIDKKFPRPVFFHPQTIGALSLLRGNHVWLLCRPQGRRLPCCFLACTVQTWQLHFIHHGRGLPKHHVGLCLIQIVGFDDFFKRIPQIGV